MATKLIAVGIGSGVDDNELNTIATDPDNENVIKVDSFDDLTSVESQLIDTTCKGW